MGPPEIKTSDTPPRAAPFQYSLRTLLILTTALAVVLSGTFAGPDWLSVMVDRLLAIVVPMVLTIGVIYGRGYVRTFCIGSLFPAGAVFLTVGPELRFNLPWMADYSPPPGDSRWSIGLSVLTVGVVIVVSGLVAVLVRWMIEGPRRRQERETFLREQTSQAFGLTAPTTPES